MKTARLEARVSPRQKRLIERAAELRGTTVTDFVTASAQEAALETIRDFETLDLNDEASRVFANTLLNPPAPNASLRMAAARYKKRMER
jgi:uncharacterized protein (DUF1778 family)